MKAWKIFRRDFPRTIDFLNRCYIEVTQFNNDWTDTCSTNSAGGTISEVNQKGDAAVGDTGGGA